MSGFIYIMSNRAMPGLLKIGRTNDLERRRLELSSATGVPVPFRIEHFAEVNDPEYAESDAHAVLFRERISFDREFFAVSLDRAKEAFAIAIKVDIKRSARAAEQFAQWILARSDLGELDTVMSWLRAVKPKDVIAALAREAA